MESLGGDVSQISAELFAGGMEGRVATERRGGSTSRKKQLDSGTEGVASMVPAEL